MLNPTFSMELEKLLLPLNNLLPELLLIKFNLIQY
jgi:hypothetical protein